MSNASLQQFIDEQRALVEQREIDSALAYWDAGLCATPEAEERAALCQAALNACWADGARYERLRALPEPEDAPDLARQRRLLLDEFGRQQMPRVMIDEVARREMEIEGIFANFRARLGAASVPDNDLRAVLQSPASTSEARRAAWMAGKQIGAEVASRLLELVAIRNAAARDAGYDNYYALSIALQELEQRELFDTLEEVSRTLEPLFLRRKAEIDQRLAQRFGIAPADLRPWHYSDPFFQEAPDAGEGDDAGGEASGLDALFAGRSMEEILVNFNDAIGLDVHALLPRADLYEKPGKNQHAYCLSVGRGTGDVRVNCNLRHDAKWMGTLLHEFGHAVYDYELDAELPFFLKTVSHTMTTEAIAEMMGRFVTNPAWLRRWALPQGGEATTEGGASVDAVAAAAQLMQVTHLLVFTQWVQVIAHFERDLYENPDQDLDALWWRYVARYQHLTPPENAPAGAWAAKIHLSTSPVYYHNYLMGEMIASQLLHVLRERVVASEAELVDNPAVGAWLIEQVFQPGARYPWHELVRRATGEPLTPRYFVEEMGG